jgi:hypothetical protein
MTPDQPHHHRGETAVTNQPAPAADDQEQAQESITARRILTEHEYGTAFEEADAAARAAGITVPPSALADMVFAVFFSVGLLIPPPEPDTEAGTCAALFADPTGEWWQCELEPHDSASKHDTGEWTWDDDSPNAIPARP